MYKRIRIALTMASVLSAFLIPGALFAEFTMPFKDVSSNAYYYNPVKLGLEKKLVTSGKYFYPARPLTRAEFIAWVVGALNIEKATPKRPSFSDVPKTSSAYSAIETGKKFGLVSGTQTAEGKPTGKFEPDRLVNRAEAAVMIMKAFAQVKEGGTSFPDLGNVDWAANAIKKAAAAGFFSGYPDKTFGPAKNILRAEGITVLMKVASKLESKELVKSFAPLVSAGTATQVGAPAKTYTAEELLKKVNAALPGYSAVNVQQSGSYVIFFGFDPEPENSSPYGWYRLSLAAISSKAEIIFTEMSPFVILLSEAIASPNGKEFLITSSDGKVTMVNIDTLAKTELGVFLTDNGKSRYSDPAYTPDGKYIVLFDKTAKNLQFDPANGLILVNAVSKDIKNGTFVSGFWMNEGGGGELETGSRISKYAFPDNTHLTFNRMILNLSTLKKE